VSKPKNPRAASTSPDARTVVPGHVVSYHNQPVGNGLPALIDASKSVRSGQKRYKHQRTIRVSVVLPASVELVVGTNDDDPDEDCDWEILAARDVRCEVSPRMVEENMHGTDFAAMAAQAANAKDDE
jgi:hypothetical protein